MKKIIWDQEDDYYNTFFTKDDEEFEVVIRKFEDEYLISIEQCDNGQFVLAESCSTYHKLLKILVDNIPFKQLDEKEIPTKSQLQLVYARWDNSKDNISHLMKFVQEEINEKN